MIRNEEDMNKHLNYIHYNPVKHGYVNAVKNWEYSSFNNFVKKGYYNSDWGKNEDIKAILDLNLE